MDLIPIPLGSLPLAHNAQHSLVIHDCIIIRVHFARRHLGLGMTSRELYVSWLARPQTSNIINFFRSALNDRRPRVQRPEKTEKNGVLGMGNVTEGERTDGITRGIAEI